MSHTVGIILTGGGSRRMGTDKASMIVAGKPMVVHVADALWEAGLHPIECQGGDAATIEQFGVTVAADPEPRAGPVAAIRAALDRHADSDVVVVACDLVDLDGQTVRALVDAGAAEARPDVAAAMSNGELHMISWWRAGTGSKLATLIGEGVDSYQTALDRLGAARVPVPTDVVRNVNTPDDLGPGE